MATQKGVASCSGTALLSTARWFHFGVDGYTINTDGSLNALPSTWEIDAGASVTLRFRTQSSGLTPTPVANKVTLIAYYETGTGTVVRTFASATTVADNATYTFYGTDNGLVGGTARCGTLRLYVQGVKDDGTAGVGNYSANSDSDNLAGALRVNMLVSDLTVGAYPAASTFAYGTGGDETITLTATHTQRYTDRDVETFRIDALDVGAVQSTGTVKEIGTTTTTQNFIANNTFDDTTKSYGTNFTVVGSSLLLPTEKWTLPKANGVNVTQNGVNVVERQSFYNVDPRVTISGVTLSQSLHNRGESTTIDFTILNARGESLTRSVSYQLKDSLSAVKKSGSDSGSNYDIDYTIGISDDASYDTVGKQWTFNTTQADVDSNPVANAYKVSNKLLIGTVAGSNDLTMASVADSIKNRGESQAFTYYVSYARGEAYASKTGLNQRIYDGITTTTEEDAQLNESTSGSGLISSSYTISVSDLANYDTIGRPKDIVLTDDLGNSCDRAEDVWFVSSKLLIGSAVGLNDLAVTTDEEIYNRGESPQLDYYLSYARGTAYANQTINTQVHDDAVTSNSEDSQNVATTAGGLISYSYTIASGDKATADNVGSPKHVEVSHNGNVTDDSSPEWTVSSLLTFNVFWTGKSDLDADANGEPDGDNLDSFFVGADVLYAKVQVYDVRNNPYDNADVTMHVLRNAVISQGPSTGAISQTESGFLGWQDLFYQFDVKAPSGARVIRAVATRDGNSTGNVEKDVTFAPSYTGNLEVTAIVKLDGTDARVVAQPYILDNSNNEQLLSAAVPSATLDVEPQITLKRYVDGGVITVQQAITSMTRTNGGSDDDWEYTFSGLTPGVYAGEISMTVNGGQLTETIAIDFVIVPSSFNYLGFAFNGVL